MLETVYTIKDASRLVGVEPHALRFWEEELGLTIERNELGRRIYLDKDIVKFKEIQEWKEQGLQLKEIRAKIHPADNNKLDVPFTSEEELKIEKAKRLQELLKQFLLEALRENNSELIHLIRDGVVKELDYQFRLQEEREDEHFRQLDENLRTAMEKGKRKRRFR